MEVYVGSQLAARMPRLHGRGQHAIHYQHLIWSLVRKPGAFAHYRYRDDLFPTVHFRTAYDHLVAHRAARADAEYLHLLHLAASTSEREVDAALALLLEQGMVPTLDDVRNLTQAPVIPHLPWWISHRMMRYWGGARMDDRHATLQTVLRELHLTTMAGVCSDVALKAAREGLSHEAYLLELARLEVEARVQRRRDRRLAESGLPREKTFATMRLDRFPAPIRLHIERIRRGEWIEQATNIIAIGPPGAGKSHLLAAVGHAMVDQGHTVLWTTTAMLVQHLLAAKRDLRLPRELAKLDRVACLILDDIGYVAQSREEMEVLFTLLSARYEQRSVLISSNLVFSQWPTIFKDPLTTAAALDRVLHHAILLDLSGMTSYRVAAGSPSATTDQAGKPTTTMAVS